MRAVRRSRRAPGKRTDSVARLGTCRLAPLADRCHPHHAAAPWPPLTRVKTLGDGRTPDAADLAPPVVPCDLCILAQGEGVIAWLGTPQPRQEVDTVSVYSRLIFFDTPDIIGPLCLERTRDVPLAPHGINGHHRPGQMPPRE